MKVKLFLRTTRNILRNFLSWLEELKLKVFYDNRTIIGYFRKKGARIGEDCFFSVRWIGDQPYLVEIGDHVYLSKGVWLETSGSNWMFEKDDPSVKIFGRIVIEDNCFIGINTQIMPNVRIGKNSIIGAGSVVINNIPPNSVAMGVPARVIGSSIKYKENIISNWNRQKPPGWSNMKPKQKAQELQKQLLKIDEE